MVGCDRVVEMFSVTYVFCPLSDAITLGGTPLFRLNFAEKRMTNVDFLRRKFVF